MQKYQNEYKLNEPDQLSKHYIQQYLNFMQKFAFNQLNGMAENITAVLFLKIFVNTFSDVATHLNKLQEINENTNDYEKAISYISNLCNLVDQIINVIDNLSQSTDDVGDKAINLINICEQNKDKLKEYYINLINCNFAEEINTENQQEEQKSYNEVLNFLSLIFNSVRDGNLKVDGDLEEDHNKIVSANPVQLFSVAHNILSEVIVTMCGISDGISDFKQDLQGKFNNEFQADLSKKQEDLITEFKKTLEIKKKEIYDKFKSNEKKDSGKLIKGLVEKFGKYTINNQLKIIDLEQNKPQIIKEGSNIFTNISLINDEIFKDMNTFLTVTQYFDYKNSIDGYEKRINEIKSKNDSKEIKDSKEINELKVLLPNWLKYNILLELLKFVYKDPEGLDPETKNLSKYKDQTLKQISIIDLFYKLIEKLKRSSNDGFEEYLYSTKAKYFEQLIHSLYMDTMKLVEEMQNRLCVMSDVDEKLLGEEEKYKEAVDLIESSVAKVISFSKSIVETLKDVRDTMCVSREYFLNAVKKVTWDDEVADYIDAIIYKFEKMHKKLENISDTYKGDSVEITESEPLILEITGISNLPAINDLYVVKDKIY